MFTLTLGVLVARMQSQEEHKVALVKGAPVLARGLSLHPTLEIRSPVSIP